MFTSALSKIHLDIDKTRAGKNANNQKPFTALNEDSVERFTNDYFVKPEVPAQRPKLLKFYPTFNNNSITSTSLTTEETFMSCNENYLNSSSSPPILEPSPYQTRTITNSRPFEPPQIYLPQTQLQQPQLQQQPFDQRPSRILLIKNIPAKTNLKTFEDICSLFGDLVLTNFEPATATLIDAVVAWFDLRDAVKAFNGIASTFHCETGTNLGGAFYLTGLSESSALYKLNLNHLLEDSAAIYVSVSESENGSFNNKSQNVLYNKLSSVGDILFLRRTDQFMNNVIYKCAFFDARMLKMAQVMLNRSSHEGYSIFAEFKASSIYQDILAQYSSLFGMNSNVKEIMLEQREPESKKETNVANASLSKTKRLTLSKECEAQYELVGKQMEMLNQNIISLHQLDTLRVTVMPVQANNAVDLVRIAKGLDTRTTIMIRNIPNKIDQAMLKAFIDASNKNTYDFLYLRIDFTKCCNVGYAFVSFNNPEDIITFAKARVGRKWNRFNSEKICDISYANIQGQECLIEKFRNSSVMNQNSEYRPKIYHTEGPHIGKEKKFPEPNNDRCHARSSANVTIRKL